MLVGMLYFSIKLLEISDEGSTIEHQKYLGFALQFSLLHYHQLLSVVAKFCCDI